MPLGETIMAPATPEGQSAIAMVRASGLLCSEIVRKALGGDDEPISRKATLAYYSDTSQKIIDQVLYTYYLPNSSYTGEALLEICCHGNPLIVQKICEDLVKRGCRIAEAGEFTRTAFLNGKMDLSQAEAVCDLITARSEKALEAAQKQLAGALGIKVNEYSDQLMQIIAEVEAYIDFPEDDLPPERVENIQSRINLLIQNFDELIETSRYKNLLQNGIKTIIIGAPNAGKSSLLNALIGEERAIVSPEPGTTRDFITEQIMIGPYSIRIMDTAGLREEGDTIERMGIQKTIEKIKEADFHIVVVDSTTERPVLSREIFDCLKIEKTIVIENKIDLAESIEQKDFFNGYKQCRISLKTREGIVEFREQLIEIFKSGVVKSTADGLIISARHAAALSSAKEGLWITYDALKNRLATEIIASELRQSLRNLQEIIGEIDNELILDKLFSTFCIGK